MSLDLVPEWTIGDLCLTSYPFGVDADSTVDIGEPEMVVETVTSMLADGDLERHVRDGNRTYVLEIYVMGATLGELSEAEATLRTELRRTGLWLTHDPGDGFSPASVYEVQTAQLTPQRRDDHESHLIRKFTLTLRCSPHARSAELTTVAAYTAGSATVSVDTCDSVTGWSSTRSGSAATVVNWIAGAVGVVELDAAVTSPETWTLTRSGSVDFSTTPFLVAEIRTLSQQQGLRVTATANGVTLPVVESRLMNDGNAFHWVVFDASGVGVAPSITFTHTSLAGEPWQGIYIRQVSRTDIPPNITTRQLTRIIHAGGTERTPVSIRVATSGPPMNFTLVHTSPETMAGYSPPLRRWRTSGNTVTSDATLFSGAREPVTLTAIEAQAPSMSMPPGEYVLAAVMRSNTAGTFPITWTTNSLIPGYGYLGDTISGVAQAKFFDPGFWNLIPLDVVTLPPVRVSDALAVVQLTLNRAPIGSEVIDLDEWWAFRIGDDCALTIVNNPGTRLWLDSPDATNAVPRVSIGDFDNKLDARHPARGLITQGNHVLHPDGTAIFVAANGADSPEVTATFHKRWHSNAAE